MLDTGVDAAAPDLTGSVLSGPDLSHSGRAANGPFFGIHGTEFASIIAGHGHGRGQNEGIIGVAPAAKILSVRVVLDSGDPMLANAAIAGGLPDAIAEGIRYATNNGATVIDLPLDPGAASATGTAGVPGLAASSPAEQSAVAYARSKGVVLVAPAGDDGTGAGIVNYPAAYPGVISVGAFDKSFTKAPFSSHQSYVTMTAAGDGVTAETPSGYTTVSSTAAASAVVAGIVALIRSAFPALTPAQVTKSLVSSTRFRRPDGRQIGSGYGTVDAERALRAATAMAEPDGQRAYTGSLARVAPVTPAVRGSRQSLRTELQRDAVLSAGLLIVLLIPAVVLAIVRRRRDRDAAPAAGGGYDDLDEQLANAGGRPTGADGIPAVAGARRGTLRRGRPGRPGGRGKAGRRAARSPGPAATSRPVPSAARAPVAWPGQAGWPGRAGSPGRAGIRRQAARRRPRGCRPQPGAPTPAKGIRRRVPRGRAS